MGIWTLFINFSHLFYFQSISDEDSELTFNPGEFFEEVRAFYSPAAKEGDRMFMKPITSCKFDVWDVNNQVLFHQNSPLGKHTVCRVKLFYVFLISFIARLETLLVLSARYWGWITEPTIL